jgi:hypothetical protein
MVRLERQETFGDSGKKQSENQTSKSEWFFHCTLCVDDRRLIGAIIRNECGADEHGASAAEGVGGDDV